MPILIALAIVFLLLALAAFRRQTPRDPLMGARGAEQPRMPLAPAAPIPPTPPSTSAVAEDLRARVMPLLARGQKINAIKLVRDETGMGLKQAKDYVESLE